MANHTERTITTTTIEVAIPIDACAADLTKAQFRMESLLSQHAIDTSFDDRYWVKASDDEIILYREIKRS